MIAANHPQHDVADLKRSAAGRWLEILTSLGGIPSEVLDGKNHPCPKCGGTDRFRFTDKDGDGSVFCNQCGKGIGDGLAALQWITGWDFPETVKRLADHLGATSSASKPAVSTPRKIVKTYDYTDEAGNLLYQVVRFEPKDFRQRKPKPGGGWDYSVKGTRLVPYRLPELAADPLAPVLIVEGEKDADRAAALGMLATTNAMGSNKWRPEYNEYFRDREVYIIPDNDQPGRDHADQVGKALSGIAKSVRIVDLPGLPPKGDLSDWLDQGHALDDLLERIAAAVDWAPAPAKPTEKAPQGNGPRMTTLVDAAGRYLDSLYSDNYFSGLTTIRIPG